MRKVVTIICESFNYTDTVGCDLEGFEKLEFNNYPANCSDIAMLCMQSSVATKPWYELGVDVPFPSSIPPKGQLVSDHVKTRLFAWPFWASLPADHQSSRSTGETALASIFSSCKKAV